MQAQTGDFRASGGGKTGDSSGALDLLKFPDGRRRKRHFGVKRADWPAPDLSARSASGKDGREGGCPDAAGGISGNGRRRKAQDASEGQSDSRARLRPFRGAKDTTP